MKRLSIFSCVLLFSLCFFELGSDGKMKKIRRSTFPVADAGNDQGDWRFQLPREGKTILIRNQRNGKIPAQAHLERRKISGYFASLRMTARV
jgi:hypothetical protein